MVRVEGCIHDGLEGVGEVWVGCVVVRVARCVPWATGLYVRYGVISQMLALSVLLHSALFHPKRPRPTLQA